MTLTLAEPEARTLEAAGRRQLAWDADLQTRVMTSGGALGMFTVPPLGVLAFVAVPVVGEAMKEPRVDRIVRLAQWVDLLRDTGGTNVDPTSLPEVSPVVGAGPSLLNLPPSTGWQVPMFAVSGDLVPAVKEATAEFESRAAGLAPRAQEALADEIWSRPAWAALPLRALHAARQLGFLPDDASRVSAASCGPWKRLSTSRGQVFVPSSGPAARLALSIAR